ncbi:MAG: zincin-like metallopeptidase domain-containing protein [Saprospiraceae bacterium]
MKNSATTETVHRATHSDLYQEITDKIIAMIEKGVAPWRQTWSSYGLARNFATGHIYTGINFLLMNNTNHPIPYFMTFNQVKELNGQIKKGAKAEMVIYFTVYYKDSNDNTIERQEAIKRRQNGEDIQVLKFIKLYHVFNVSDIEGIDIDLNKFIEVKLNPNERIERCEQIIMNMPKPPTLRQIDANRAFYSPADDFINLPYIKQFKSSEHYYATYFHELVHSTGHSSRLARPGVMDFNGFGSTSYSKEELVAEMGASFLCSHSQIDYDSIVENNASYLAGWLKVMKEDPKFIFQVSAEAQKAVNYVYNLNPEL